MPHPSVNRLPTSQLSQILTFVVALFAVHIVNFISGMSLIRFGVIPRSIIGIRGIIFSPLLHVSWAHLIANTVPLAIMLGLLAFAKGRSLWAITGAIWVVSGFAVWLVGRPGSVQIGASGLIYGLAAYLITAAWVHRDLKSALAALVVFALYGSIAWGLLPVRQGVSWEGHIAGAIAGYLIARMSIA